jgi:hypothetical protein
LFAADDRRLAAPEETRSEQRRVALKQSDLIDEGWNIMALIFLLLLLLLSSSLLYPSVVEGWSHGQWC